MKIFGIITLLFVVVVVVTHAENKYSSNQTDGCEKDSTQQHCLKKKDHQMEGVDDDDGEPEFYDEDDDVKEDPAQKWKGRQALYQWDPVKVSSFCILIIFVKFLFLSVSLYMCARADLDIKVGDDI